MANIPEFQRVVLKAYLRNCPVCHRKMWAAYNNQRRLTMFHGKVPLLLKIVRCTNKECRRYHVPYRPEYEGHYALSHCQYAIELILAVGETARKYHATLYELVNGIPPWSLAKTKKMFKKHGLVMSKRSVWNLRQKYDALLKTSPANDPKILAVVQSQKYLVLDIFEVPSHGDWPPLWIVRDWFCGVILAAISVPDQQMAKLFEAIGKVRCECGVPVIGFISDGHPLIKNTILSFLSNKAENLSRYLELAEKTFKSWRDLPAFLESLTCLDEVLAKDLCPPRLWRTQ